MSSSVRSVCIVSLLAGTILMLPSDGHAQADSVTDPPASDAVRCVYLTPQPLRLSSNVTLMPPANKGPMPECGGVIGVVSTCSGMATFTNNNKGTRNGYIELGFTGTAPGSGTATLQAENSRGKLSAPWTLSGDYTYSAPDGKPDSSIKLKATSKLTVAGTAKLNKPANLLNENTFGAGRAGTASKAFDVLHDGQFQVSKGQAVEYVLRLDIESYSSAKGTVSLFVNTFGIPANVWNTAVKICV